MYRPSLQLVQGTVRGVLEDGVEVYRAVPYAQAPVGRRRFKSPEPRSWVGVWDAGARGPSAPQRTRGLPGLDAVPLVGEGWREGDDYLAVDLFRPAVAGSGRPIMVFVHGGGFVAGARDAPVQDGTSFARDGVVFVSVSYRLGVDGFLPIAGIPTNLGLRDILAALDWVRGNAAPLGGDADNVTVFGESAGAMAIADLVASPLAKGLFRRAIIQSGHGAMTRDVATARRLADKLAAQLRIAADRTGFASISPAQTLDALDANAKSIAKIDLRGADGREPVFGISRFVPVHGDDVLPEVPHVALGRGAGAEIDVLIGTNAEEMNLYLVPAGVLPKLNRVLAWLILRRSLPRAWKALKAYGSGGGRTGAAFARAMSDLVFRWPARRFAEEHAGRTWMYEFDWRSPRWNGELGAAHGMELPFVFDSLSTVTGPEGLVGETPPQDLATRVHALWVRFATDGTLPWPEFTRTSRNVHHLGSDVTIDEPTMPAAEFLP